MFAKINRNFSTIYEFIIFVYILLVALAISTLLKVIKFQTILEKLTPRKKSLWEGKVSPKRISEYIDSILALKILGMKPNCLNRSLVLYHFLHKIGIMVKINFGVRKIDNDIQGHGWLTLDGKPYLEESDTLENFCLIYSYPDHRQAFRPQIYFEGVV
jgi:hypothetical protein